LWKQHIDGLMEGQHGTDKVPEEFARTGWRISCLFSGALPADFASQVVNSAGAIRPALHE
jgi:hypothetical protein